ncbi:MAG: hypothetical protein ACP5MX_01520 [Candidatus Micrarchaeia archaeon]
MNRIFVVLLYSILLLSLFASVSYSTTNVVCHADTPIYGFCDGTGSSSITTYYPDAGGGSIVQSSSTQSDMPTTSSVLKYNSNYAQWLITCPSQPNPLDTTEYFYTTPNSFIGGDSCLASTQPLQTSAQLTSYTSWSTYSLASTSVSFSLDNPGIAQVQNIAYSGESSLNGAMYNISNGYDSNSYIYESVPSVNQSSIWSWSAEYAKLSEFKNAIQNGDFHLSDSFSGLQYSDGPFTAVTQGTPSNTLTVWYCDYTYNYQFNSDLTKLNNTNVTIPVSLLNPPQNNYIEYLGQYFTPVHYYHTYYLSILSFPPFWESGWSEVGTGTVDTSYYTGSATIYTYTGLPGNYIAAYSCWVNTCTVEAPIESTLYSRVPILPYFLYNITMPALFSTVSNTTEFLNLSFDMYSPHNYLAPANYLDSFPIYTNSGFFANYSDSLSIFPSGISSISSTVSDFVPEANFFLSNMNAGSLSSISNIFNNIIDELGSAGNYAYLSIRDPQFISASPNDYIYVINYTDTSSGFLNFNQKSNAYLYIFRFIPTGYYNISNDQPNALQSSSLDWSTWNSLWVNYWNNVLKEQSTDLYLVNVVDLAQSRSSWWGFYNYGIIPTAVTSDYSNDVFFTGDYKWTNKRFFLGAFFSNGIKEGQGETQPAGFLPSSEFAVSPGGQNIYLANQYYPGNIVLYQSPSFNYEGEINLTYSNSTYNMNITAYLANGGPFDNAQIASVYNGMPTVNDIQGFHYPIAISDDKGLLYVFDIWNFSVDGNPSSFLIMRVFSANNTELPINPQNYTTMFPVNSQAISTSQGTGQQIVDPPYGWVLSANISIGNNQYISYCAADCTYTPNKMHTDYPPIGPQISAFGITTLNPYNISVSTSFNGTFNMVAHIWQWPYSGTFGNPLYTEFLSFYPKVDNYTKLLFAADTPYSCYINESYSGACTYNTIIANVITDIWPPFELVPSSFSYVEGEGSPEAYLTLTNTFSALFPQQTSSSSSSSAANSFNNNGITNPNSVSPNTIGYTTPSTTGALLSKQPITFLNSNIAGYVLVPYNYSYYLNQNWQQTSEQAVDITTSSTDEPAYGTPLACGSISTSTSNVYAGYTTAEVPVSSSSLNVTVQGGPTYLQYRGQNTYYIPNLSDAGAIMFPYINYEMSTNRNFGEIFVNQTVNTTGGMDSPDNMLNPQLVINAARNYVYNENIYDQSAYSNTQFFAAYAAQTATTQQVPGANCGGYCPSPYYYAQNLFSGPSVFLYSENPSTNFQQLFEVYQRASYLNNMVLILAKSHSILGYNRLVFTYVDSFNNTIYMPLDVDFSNITTLIANANPVVDPTNSNSTTIYINGTLLSATPIGTYPVPNADVYLYYDTNINYYNSSYPSNDLAYYTNSLKCAFGFSSKSCTLANPLATVTQAKHDGPAEAKLIDYFSQASSDSCPPEPSSLLQGPGVFNCNIFGDNGLQAVNSINGQYEYCVPYFDNGTGVFTTQLGLAKIAKTNANGEFQAKIPACGTGDAKIIAQYYGNPPPEPLYVYQPGLSFSTPNAGGSPLVTLEFNYTTSPSTQVVNTQIGNFMLPIGNISAYYIILVVASIAAMIAISFWRKNRQ